MTGIVGRTYLERGEPVYPYVWAWRWRTWTILGARSRTSWFGDGVDRVGQRCRVVARGSMNSALVEFESGYRVVTSRGGLRKATSSPPAADARAASRRVSAGATRRGRE